jgi:hypothetical protein
MKKKIFLLIVAFIALCLTVAGLNFYSGQTSKDKLKEGDMIFHISKSEQSPLIQYATNSTLSHCGIIIEKKDGLYVLEATKTLRLTPLDQFINRGKGNLWWAKRVIDEPIKIKYKNLLGRRYDRSFKKDNNLFYCSELLWHIYKTQFDIELCEYKKVSDYNLTGLKDKLKKRGINENQLVVAPVDIFNSKKAHNI